MSEMTKLRKQTEKLEMMKNVALSKLAGLQDFQTMFYSKFNFTQALSDSELLDAFQTKYGQALPMKYFDCILVHDLSPKPQEETVDDGSKVMS